MGDIMKSSSSSSNHGTEGVLELTLTEILAVIKPTEEDKAARERVIDELKAIVSQSAMEYSSLQGAKFDMLGSHRCNLDTRWGDLDITIHIQDPFLRWTALADLYDAVNRRGHIFRITKFTPNARIPLLVVESNDHNSIKVDISINKSKEVTKSISLGCVAQIDDRFKDMVILVKEWANTQNINSARDGTLASYALCLLVIFHFQTCEPPILPPLKEIIAGESDYADSHDRHNLMTANVEKFKRERLTNTSSLSELFVSFFQKFSTIDMENYNFFCTYDGKWEQWEDYRLNEVLPLHIDDPFDRHKNVARAVDDTTRISEAFKKTYSMLISASESDRFSLISNLVRPEIRSQIITRA